MLNRYLKICAGSIGLIIGGIWFLHGIGADLTGDGYAALFVPMGFYALWTWMAGYCFCSAGTKAEMCRGITWFLWFAGYLYLLARFTLFEPSYERELHFWWMLPPGERTVYLTENVNLIPFHSLILFWRALRYGYLPWTACIWNILGNLAAFVPMPFFLMIPARRKSPLPVLLQTAGIIVLVELLQLLTMCGRPDVDDFLLNFGGAAIFTGIFTLFRTKSHKL